MNPLRDRLEALQGSLSRVRTERAEAQAALAAFRDEFERFKAGPGGAGAFEPQLVELERARRRKAQYGFAVPLVIVLCGQVLGAPVTIWTLMLGAMNIGLLVAQRPVRQRCEIAADAVVLTGKEKSVRYAYADLESAKVESHRWAGEVLVLRTKTGRLISLPGLARLDELARWVSGRISASSAPALEAVSAMEESAPSPEPVRVRSTQ